MNSNSGHGLSKSEIIRQKQHIERLFRKGTFIRSDAFDLIVIRGTPSRKVLFAVSKNVRKKVERNRIKRRFREIYRTHKQLLPDNLHLAIIGKENSIKKKFADLTEEYINVITLMIRQ